MYNSYLVCARFHIDHQEFISSFSQVLQVTPIQMTLRCVLWKYIQRNRGNLQQAAANMLGLISKVMFVWGTFSQNIIEDDSLVMRSLMYTSV